jgi:acyl carrier protein
MLEANAVDTKIHMVLDKCAKLGRASSTLPPDSDLYNAGMTSLASVSVMLAIEEMFNIEFPDHMLNKKVFGSIGALRVAILELSATTHVIQAVGGCPSVHGDSIGS